MEVWVSQDPEHPDSAIKLSATENWYVSDAVKECSKLFVFDGDLVPAGELVLCLKDEKLNNRTKLSTACSANEVFIVEKRAPPTAKTPVKGKKRTTRKVTSPPAIISSTPPNKPTRSRGEWIHMVNDFYARHSHNTLCIVPYVLSKYEGDENRLWEALLLRHNVTDATWDSKPRVDVVHIALASSLSLLTTLSPTPVSPLQASPSSGGITCSDSFEARRFLSEVSKSTAKNGSSSMRRAPNSVPGHVSMASIDSTVHALNDTKLSCMEYVDSVGEDDEGDGEGDTERHAKATSEDTNDIEQHHDLLNSMRKLLEASGTVPPENVELRNVEMEIEDEDPNNSTLNRTTEIKRRLSEAANSDARSTESFKRLLESVGTRPVSSGTPGSPEKDLGLSRTLEDVMMLETIGEDDGTLHPCAVGTQKTSKSMDSATQPMSEYSGSRTTSPEPDDPLMGALNTAMEAVAAFDDLDTDSEELPEAMSTFDQKQHFHKLIDSDVKGLTDVRGLLTGISCVPMTDPTYGKLSPRIELGLRPLTPREKAHERAQRKRQSITLKSLTGVEVDEDEEGRELEARRKLSSLATSDVKSTASMRRLLNSMGTLAMTDEDGTQLTPRLAEGRETPRGIWDDSVKERTGRGEREKSVEKKKEIATEDGTVFNIEVISCSTKSEAGEDAGDAEEEQTVEPEISAGMISTPVAVVLKVDEKQDKDNTEKDSSSSSTSVSSVHSLSPEAMAVPVVIVDRTLGLSLPALEEPIEYPNDRLEPKSSNLSSKVSSRASTPKIPPLNLGGLSPVSPMLKIQPGSDDVPLIIEPVPDPEEKERKKKANSDAVRKMLEGVGTMQSMVESPKEKEKEKEKEKHDEEAPTDEEGPSLDEIKRVIPQEVINVLNLSGAMGTTRCSVRKMYTPKDIAASSLCIRGSNPFGLKPDDIKPGITMRDVLATATSMNS